MDNLLLIILTAIAIATFLNIFLKYFHIPTIIGYILTGTIITYIFSLHYNADLAHIAEFGIVFLMFTIGLEFSVKRLMSMKKEVFFNGSIQVLVTGGIFSLLAQYVFDIEQKSAIIIGFAFALSSTAIVLKILNDSGDIHTKYGRKSLGILLFQDIAVIPLLLMINIFMITGVSVPMLIGKTLISAVLVIGLLFVVGKYLLNPFFARVVSLDSDEIFIASVILIVVGASYFAHALGFTYSLGAFLAGMIIAETKYRHQVKADLIPFRDMLLGLFFITVGMQINLSIVAEYFVEIILLLVAVMSIKATVIFVLLSTYVSKRISLKTALSLSQVGEFTLAVFALASAGSLIDPITNQILIVMVTISMILTPFILKNIKAIADKVLKENTEDYTIYSSGLKEHIIVCGYGKLGQEIIYRLKKMDLKFIVIEHDIDLVKLGKQRGEPVFFGNAAMKSILIQNGVESCQAVIVTFSNEKKLIRICEVLNSFKNPINTVVKVVDYEEKQLLKDLNVNHIVNEGREVAKSLIRKALLK